MTFQERLNANKWAGVALEVPQKYRVPNSRLMELAQHLFDFEAARTEAGKVTNKDLLMQEATKWAKKEV